ncbi:glycosyltransferase family 2 protein [Patescibacteria group bacterium]|nr:glycosyltransferase family 2 protein [Patescibacteria group bacterium]
MPNEIQVTVIIPTYNRCELLKDNLKRLQNQSFVKSEYEIVVVNDGSTDDTEKVVKQAALNSKVHIEYLYQKNQGQGIARNYALRFARGKIVIFIGDDMLVLPDFIKQHMKFHRKHLAPNAAVLGFVAWDPRLEITPFMEWLTNGSSIFGKFGGHQFAFEKLEGKEKADYNFFYTANLSLKRELLQKHPFDSRFSSYGWEDIELGYRLTKKEGLVLYYNPMAIAYHYHELNESSLAHRMRMVGKSAHLIHAKYPELGKVPSAKKKFVFKLLSNPLSLWFLKVLKTFSGDRLSAIYYYALSKKYFLEGLELYV